MFGVPPSCRHDRAHPERAGLVSVGLLPRCQKQNIIRSSALLQAMAALVATPRLSSVRGNLDPSAPILVGPWQSWSVHGNLGRSAAILVRPRRSWSVRGNLGPSAAILVGPRQSWSVRGNLGRSPPTLVGPRQSSSFLAIDRFGDVEAVRSGHPRHRASVESRGAE
jgi:hypothetical protein